MDTRSTIELTPYEINKAILEYIKKKTMFSDASGVVCTYHFRINDRDLVFYDSDLDSCSIEIKNNVKR